MTISGNGQLDRLKPSDQDTVGLCKAVKTRFVELQELCRRTGHLWLSPKGMRGDFIRFKALCQRHARGDMRNSRAELLALRAVAQWTVTQNMAIKNQPPKVVEWKD